MSTVSILSLCLFLIARCHCKGAHTTPSNLRVWTAQQLASQCVHCCTQHTKFLSTIYAEAVHKRKAQRILKVTWCSALKRLSHPAHIHSWLDKHAADTAPYAHQAWHSLPCTRFYAKASSCKWLPKQDVGQCKKKSKQAAMYLPKDSRNARCISWQSRQTTWRKPPVGVVAYY